MLRGCTKYQTYTKRVCTRCVSNKNVNAENTHLDSSFGLPKKAPDPLKQNKLLRSYNEFVFSHNVAHTFSKVLSTLQGSLDGRRITFEKGNQETQNTRHLLRTYSRTYTGLMKRSLFGTSAAVAITEAEINKRGSESSTDGIAKSIAESSGSQSVAPSVDQPTNLDVIDPIPEPPVAPDLPVLDEVVNQLNALGEPTFASLGLGGYTPVGLVQSCFEYLHVTLGIPWWEVIVIGTLFIRLVMFPLVVLSQRNSAKMNNCLPQMQALQLKMTEARQTGNSLEVARYSQELMLFMKEKGVNPFKNMIMPLAQMPVFISFFVGLRQMANVPVDSLREGGIFWFQDLTVPDQYFLMPIITSVTLWLTIELGTDTAKLSAQNLQTMKYVLRALPVVILPFTVNFPGVILCYWVSSNFISLAQVGFLRIPAVRDYFKIEPLMAHKPEHLPMKPKSFKEGLKDTWTNLKITNELEERRRLDEIQFRRAGKGPIVKTYKFDPTQQISPNAISAKKR